MLAMRCGRWQRTRCVAHPGGLDDGAAAHGATGRTGAGREDAALDPGRSSTNPGEVPRSFGRDACSRIDRSHSPLADDSCDIAGQPCKRQCQVPENPASFLEDEEEEKC